MYLEVAAAYRSTWDNDAPRNGDGVRCLAGFRSIGDDNMYGRRRSVAARAIRVECRCVIGRSRFRRRNSAERERSDVLESAHALGYIVGDFEVAFERARAGCSNGTIEAPCYFLARLDVRAARHILTYYP